MNTCIYTIAKNESKNVLGFMEASEGCPVYVLDTGSTDDTVDLFKKYGAVVEQKIITPWRFDTARNESLALVPKDYICISLDLDERIEKNWQEKLKDEWHPEANYGNYRYISDWNDKEKTIPAVETARTRIHSSNGFHWERIVHEIPVPDDGIKLYSCDTTILVKHYSNGKQRNYVPLLTQLLELDPNDADARLQRGGEYAQKAEWSNAIVDYKAWLRINFGDERPPIKYRRAFVHISLAQCYFKLDQKEQSIQEFMYAIASEPGCREAWVHFAHVSASMGKTALALGAIREAMNIKQPPYYACTESFCWTDYPERLCTSLLEKIKGEI